MTGVVDTLTVGGMIEELQKYPAHAKCVLALEDADSLVETKYRIRGVDCYHPEVVEISVDAAEELD